MIAADEPQLVGRKLLWIARLDGRAEQLSTLPTQWAAGIARRAAALFQEDDKRRVRVESFAGPGPARVAFERFEPPVHVVIAGAGHIAVPACEIFAALGYSVTVLDDRPSYADPARFPKAERVVCAGFREGIEALPIDARTAVVVVTRGHLHDLEVLRALVGRPAFYVGMIGSRRRVLTVVRALAEEGVPEAFIQGLYAPIGLDIGAESPAEIALAIAAEVVSVARGGRGGHLRDARRRVNA